MDDGENLGDKPDTELRCLAIQLHGSEQERLNALARVHAAKEARRQAQQFENGESAEQ